MAKGAWTYAQAPHPGTGPGTNKEAVFNIYVSHEIPPQLPTPENIAKRQGNIDREARFAAAEKAADDSRIERTRILALSVAEINTLSVADLKDAIRARNNWMVINGKPIMLSGKKNDLAARLVEYERLRSVPGADGAGAAGGPPRELEAEAAHQLVEDLVSALELAEPQEPADLEAGSVDCDGDEELDEVDL